MKLGSTDILKIKHWLETRGFRNYSFNEQGGVDISDGTVSVFDPPINDLIDDYYIPFKFGHVKGNFYWTFFDHRFGDYDFKRNFENSPDHIDGAFSMNMGFDETDLFNINIKNFPKYIGGDISLYVSMPKMIKSLHIDTINALEDLIKRHIDTICVRSHDGVKTRIDWVNPNIYFEITGLEDFSKF